MAKTFSPYLGHNIHDKAFPIDSTSGHYVSFNLSLVQRGWEEPTRTLVPWRQGFRHPTRNECMGGFAQIV